MAAYHEYGINSYMQWAVQEAQSLTAKLLQSRVENGTIITQH